MRTTNVGNATFIYDGDFSGDVIIQNGSGGQVAIKGSELAEFICLMYGEALVQAVEDDVQLPLTVANLKRLLS